MRPVVRWWLAVCVSCVIAGCSPPAPPPSSQADSGPESARRWLEGNGVTVRSFRGGSGGIGFGFVVGKRNDRLVIATPCHVLFGSGQGLGEDCNAASGPPERIQVSFYSAPENRYSAEITQLPGAVQRDLDLAFVELDQPPGIQPFRLSALRVEDLQSGRRAWSFGRTGEWLNAPPAGTYQQVERERPGRLIFDGLVTPSGSSGSPVLTNQGLVGLVLTNRGNETSTVLQAEQIIRVLKEAGLTDGNLVVVVSRGAGTLPAAIDPVARRDLPPNRPNAPALASSAASVVQTSVARDGAVCPPVGARVVYRTSTRDGQPLQEEWQFLGAREGDSVVCRIQTVTGILHSVGAIYTIGTSTQSNPERITDPNSSLEGEKAIRALFPLQLHRNAEFIRHNFNSSWRITYRVVGEGLFTISGASRRTWVIERLETGLLNSYHNSLWRILIDQETGIPLSDELISLSGTTTGRPRVAQSISFQ